MDNTSLRFKEVSLYSLLVLLIILLAPVTRIGGIIPTAKNYATDFQAHSYKIKALYYGESFPELYKYMENYPSLFHRIVYNLSLRNLDNINSVFAILMIITIILYRIALFLLILPYENKVTMTAMLLFLELPYFLPHIMSSIIGHPLYQFAPGFWSLEVLTVYFFTLPSFMVITLSMLSLKCPRLWLLAFIFGMNMGYVSGKYFFFAFFALYIYRRTNRRVVFAALASLMLLIIYFTLGHYPVWQLRQIIDNLSSWRLWVSLLTFLICFSLYRPVKNKEKQES